jgi:hypothetical protein
VNIRIDPALVPEIKAYCKREGLKNVSAGVHRLIILSLPQGQSLPSQPVQTVTPKPAQTIATPTVSVPSFGGFGGGLKL